MTSTIRIRCPICPNDPAIESPEELCGHMAQFHDIHSTMQSKCFESFAHFQIWLSIIEDSRCDDGGYLGSSQGPSYEDVSFLKAFSVCNNCQKSGNKLRPICKSSVPAVRGLV
uniref:Uncharacterized protein n=1 Tax=Caenorhabditis japonica TaxID=281687 RepID=A0A8R1ELA7_CAEJA